MEIDQSYKNFLKSLPEVEAPKYTLTFSEKIGYTFGVLVLFYLLSETLLYGLTPQVLDIFRRGGIGNFGSMLTLGIWPIITSYLILQLLVPNGVLNLDLKKREDRDVFNGLVKILAIILGVIEATMFVSMGALPVVENSLFLKIVLFLQLIFGVILLLLMDEIVRKWGIGSGIGLFLVAIVSFNFLMSTSSLVSWLPSFFQSIQFGVVNAIPFVPITAVILVFLAVIYLEQIRINVSGGAERSKYNRFIYMGNIISVSLALSVKGGIEFLARAFDSFGYPVLGKFISGFPVTGLAYYLRAPHFFSENFDLLQATFYSIFIIIFSMLSTVFVIKFMGIDAKILSHLYYNHGLDSKSVKFDSYMIPIFSSGILAILFIISGVFGTMAYSIGLILAIDIMYNLYVNNPEIKKRLKHYYRKDQFINLLEKAPS